jgi:hypothetical protein
VPPSRMLESLLDPSIGLYFLGVFGDSAGNLRVVLSTFNEEKWLHSHSLYCVLTDSLNLLHL